MRDVRIVLRQGAVVLVEWDDDDNAPHRSIVPKQQVAQTADRSGLVDDDLLMAGLQAGIDWAVLIGKVSVTEIEIACALKRAGFWSYLDIEKRPVEAQKVICETLGVRASVLTRLAKKREV